MTAKRALPQGDAFRAGTAYGSYKGNRFIDTFTTDANGQFTTKYYICGDDRLLKKISPSVGLRNYCICALMLDSGLRRSEVIREKISDLHIFEGYAIINGKGNKQRCVPLGNVSKKHLIKYTSLRPCVIDTESLFLTKQNTPIKNAAIARIFKTVKVTKVGDVNLTRRIYPHLLRHTFATTFLENGGNIYALQQILGHTTPDMVKKYVHLTQAKTVVNFDKYSPLDNLN